MLVLRVKKNSSKAAVKSFVKIPVWDLQCLRGGKKHVGARDNPLRLEAENYGWTAYNGEPHFLRTEPVIQKQSWKLKRHGFVLLKCYVKSCLVKNLHLSENFYRRMWRISFSGIWEALCFFISFVVIGKDVVCFWPRIDVVSKWGRIMTYSFILF